jgi:quercetin dioxygenase-like cupin family protein
VKRFLCAVLLVVGTACAQDAKVTPLMDKDLAGVPGKETTMITVEYAPGAKDAIHQHHAYVFVMCSKALS